MLFRRAARFEFGDTGLLPTVKVTLGSFEPSAASPTMLAPARDREELERRIAK